MPPKRIRVTEGSCWQCKDRRVRCDTKKPACGRCAVEGHVCDYGRVRLRWGNQLASRGRLAGQSIPLESPSLNALSRRDSTGPWQLQYFEQEILTRFSLAEKAVSIDLNRINNNTVLFNAVRAIASTHLLFQQPPVSDEALRDRIRARSKAIRSFREKLQETSQQMPTTDIFQASILLCVLDGMLEPQTDCAATQIHYQGGKAIVQGNHALENLRSERSGLPSLLVSIFATIDVTHAIFNGSAPVSTPSFWRNAVDSDAWWTGLTGEIAFLEIMAILVYLAKLGNELYCSGTLPPISDVLSLQLSLERTKAFIPPVEDPASNDGGKLMNITERTSMEMFCTAYRCTANVYLYRTLCNLEIDDALVQACVTDGVDAIIQTDFSGKLIHCLLFPILILGSHCLQATRQESLLRCLEPILQYLQFGSVKELRDFLIDTWNGKGNLSNWWEHFQTISIKAFLF